MTDSNTDPDTDPEEQPEHTRTDTGSLEEAVGMSIPDDHVGAFVAEVFEDAERSTTWDDVVDAMVAPSARDAWAELSSIEQAIEVLKIADRNDRRAADTLTAIEIRGDEPDAETREAFEEAMRLRRNADAFRDGVADAYGEGRLDDEDLIAAIEAIEFDTEEIARREEELERVVSAYGFDYRPYGGTLM